MSKKFNSILDLNVALKSTVLRIEDKGKRKAYSDTSKSKKDVEEFPDYIRCKITDDPTGLNTDAELQIKLRTADNLEIGQQLILGNGKLRIVGGQLTFWANKTSYHGKEWIFVNASAKGDHIDAWN